MLAENGTWKGRQVMQKVETDYDGVSVLYCRIKASLCEH